MESDLNRARPRLLFLDLLCGLALLIACWLMGDVSLRKRGGGR